MPAELGAIVADLAVEHGELDALVAGLPRGQWAAATPAVGWSIHDSIAHLAYYDERATVCARDPERFVAELPAELAVSRASGGEAHLADGRELAPADLLRSWREGRAALLAALRPLDPAVRLPGTAPR